MSTVLAALTAAAVVVVTYAFCIRPMRPAHGHRAVTGESGRDTDLNRQIADLREEIRVLRAQDRLDGQLSTRSHPPEPHG